MPDRRRRSRRRLGWGIGAVCVAGAVAGTVIAETVSGGSTGYQMATTTTASVQSLLTATGTVGPVNRSTSAFQSSGTVATVAVTVGQQVTAGQTLATLTPATLQKAVTAAQSNLDAAEATLTADESAQSSSSTATDPSSGAAGATTTVHAAQQAVVSAQQAADSAEQTATADLAAAQTACGTGTGSSGQGSTGSGTAPSGGHGGTTPATVTGAGGATGATTGGAVTPAASSSSASTTTSAATCTSALTRALAAQNEVATAQKAVTRAESQLASILSSSASSGSPSGAGTTGSGSTGSGSSHTTHGASGTASDSPATLASDQSTIDSDQATLIEAQQALAAAQLTSPISGTVEAVDLTAGEAVTAGSTTDVITIVDTSSYEATVSLTSSQVTSVKVGDDANVSVDGNSQSLHGLVTRVGPVDVSSGNTYPVVVTLAAGTSGIFTGSAAQVSIVISHAKDTLVVPTSAVHRAGAGRAYVYTVSSGHETETPVTLGVMGDDDTQVTKGLHLGEQVVLADLTEPVPTSNTTTTSRFGGLSALDGGGGGPVDFKISGAPGGAVAFTRGG